MSTIGDFNTSRECFDLRREELEVLEVCIQFFPECIFLNDFTVYLSGLYI